MDHLIDVCVYPDGEQYEEAPSWKSDDYEQRKTILCVTCDEVLEIVYLEPFANCKCGQQEWHY